VVFEFTGYTHPLYANCRYCPEWWRTKWFGVGAADGRERSVGQPV